MAKDKDKGTSMPTAQNPGTGGGPAILVPTIFDAVYTGLVWAGLKYGNAEAVLASAISPFVQLDAHKALLLFVILAGFLQTHMACNTNGARKKFEVPWPHTFAPHGHPDKVAFDCVQRAHLNFVENYTQVLALTYFAVQDTPYWGFVSAVMFLFGRLVFANGYYTGNAVNKDRGAFGYMLGYFPLKALVYLYAAKQFGVPLP